MLVHSDAPIVIDRCKHKLVLKLIGETVIQGNQFFPIYYCSECGYWEYSDDPVSESMFYKK